jgi:4-hydroxybenzoate polyprenyltransferase
VIPRRNLLAAGALLLLLAVILTVGTHDYTGLIVGVIFFVAFAYFLWQRTRGTR